MRTTEASGAASDRGFMMVALLIGMAIAAIYMTAALPAWRQQAQRVKEEDLVFRGEQYARAIMLFQDKNRGANPPDIDTLVSQHFLRKKWKDPVTGEDFVPVGIGVAVPGQTPGAGQPQTPGRAGAPGAGQPSAPISGQQPGITGVRSKSTATSIKIYQNQQQYNLWQFDSQFLRARLGRLVQQQGGRPTGPGGDRRGGEPTTPPRGGQSVNPIGRPGGGPVGPGGSSGSGPAGAPPGGRVGGSN